MTVRTKTSDLSGLTRQIPSWQRAALATVVLAAALVQLSGSRAAVANTPDVIGQWSAPVDWPLVAVHMSLLPTGKVLAFDAWEDAPNSEKIWDPATGSFQSVPYGRNLFCAGHLQLADGRTFIAGGNVTANDGLADTTIFNSSNNTYFRGPDMSVARWYPTTTQLADGRVLTFAGDNIVQDRPGATPPFSDASVDSLPSIYNPTTNTWTDLTSAKLTSPLYPFMFLLSDGRVFNAGPDKTTRTLDVSLVDLVDGRHEPDRRHERRHVPAEQDHEVGLLGRSRLLRRPGLQRRRGHGRDRHERPDARSGGRRLRWRTRARTRT